MSPTLSVVIPVFNEANTILDVINQVRMVPIAEKEIVIVDDGSTDGTRKVLESIKGEDVKVILHLRNRGKGAALRTGFQEATGDYIVVQDADLEYDPMDFVAMFERLTLGDADILYGSRFLRANAYSHWKYRLANIILTQWANLLYGSRLTDAYTCYKMFPRELLDSLELKSNRFEIEAELTAKLLKSGKKIIEVPVSYNPRSVLEGKKIRTSDGFLGIWTLAKIRVVS
jgi:glycosyltransferase involved in cell wall biosynthesis